MHKYSIPDEIHACISPRVHSRFARKGVGKRETTPAFSRLIISPPGLHLPVHAVNAVRLDALVVPSSRPRSARPMERLWSHVCRRVRLVRVAAALAWAPHTPVPTLSAPVPACRRYVASAYGRDLVRMVVVILVGMAPVRHVGVTRATRDRAPQAAATPAAAVLGVVLEARAWVMAVERQRPVMTVPSHRRQGVHVVAA